MLLLAFRTAPAVEPTPGRSFDKTAARLAFRRRSISEDTYNRSSQFHHNVDEDADDSGPLTADPSQRAVGVVCSNEDLKAIVHLHKRRQSQSPSVSPTTEFMPSLASDEVTTTVTQTVSVVLEAPVTPSTPVVSSVEAKNVKWRHLIFTALLFIVSVWNLDSRVRRIMLVQRLSRKIWRKCRGIFHFVDKIMKLGMLHL